MDSPIFLLVARVLGGVAGAGFSWLWLRSRLTTDGAAKLATLQERLAGREQEVQKLEATVTKEELKLTKTLLGAFEKPDFSLAGYKDHYVEELTKLMVDADLEAAARNRD